MLFPAGVTSYTDMWVNTGQGRNIFLKGNDNSIYAAGTNGFGQLGVGNTTDVNLNVAPVKVIFPAGVNNIVKISNYIYGNSAISLALTADGNAYGWGTWKIISGGQHTFAATPVVGALSGNNLLLPSPIAIPTLNSDTKFIDILAGNYNSVVKTDKMAYFKGLNNTNIVMSPVTSNSINYTGSSKDSVDGAKYNLAVPVWNQFKTFIIGGTINQQTVFAINATDKAYVWGHNFRALAGIGGGIDTTNIGRPTPIATGIGDPLNTNPLY
jgi:alpha-tubulin suppressor-like RCC1 family protein